MRLFVGDDGTEDHHDVEVTDETGRALARKRPLEGAAGMELPPALPPTRPLRRAETLA
jgi:hypothetical protein